MPAKKFEQIKSIMKYMDPLTKVQAIKFIYSEKEAKYIMDSILTLDKVLEETGINVSCGDKYECSI